MEESDILVALLFFAPFLTLFIVGFFIVRNTFHGKSGKIDYLTICNILNKYEYFRKLTPQHQDLFIKKLNSFNNGTNYYGEEGLTVTDEMRIIIAAGFTKLTMGINFRKLYVFHSILLYPKAYHDEAKRIKHLGKTSPEGYIAFSWEDVLKGEDDLHDGVNLAIHEFAHVLVVEMMQDQIIYEIKYHIVRQIYYTGKKEIDAFNQGKEPVFRKYAYSSPHEFFAIAVEIFFELPEKLIQHHWKTYRNLCILFNQNPMAKEIGNINWKSILEYSHESGSFSKITETLKFGPYIFNNCRFIIEIDKNESRIYKKNFWGRLTLTTYPHESFLFTTSKIIPTTSYSIGEYQLKFYYLKNNKISTSSFTSSGEEQINEIINIYREIGLAN